jgi:pimeloyl-ACP methyl ester carboxylesterase
MSETALGFRELRATDHSLHLVGSVMVDETIVRFRDEQPLEQASERYVFANGYGGTKESMALPRCVAAHGGYDARAMGSNHNHFENTISRYAGEIAAVAGLEDEKSTRKSVDTVHLVGISMGGAAVIRAALLCPKVATVTAEVPACLSDSSQLLDLLQGVPDHARELSSLIRNQPGFALRTAFFSLLGTIRRPLGFLGEAIDLATEKVTEDIRNLRQMERPPEVRILVGDRDGLVRKRGVIQAANRLGVEILVIDTGHVNGVLTDPKYTQRVIDMNKAA